MDLKKIENAIKHIVILQETLCYCESNLQYIRCLRSLKYWLRKFNFLLDNASRLNGEYAAIFKSYFTPYCGFSFYDKVINSIIAYEYGEKPF